MCRQYSDAGRRHKLARADEIRKEFAELVIDENYDNINDSIDELGNAHAALYDLSGTSGIREAYPEQYDNWFSTTSRIIANVQSIDSNEIGKRKVTRLTQTFFDGDIVSSGREGETADTKGYLAVNPATGLEFKQDSATRSVDIRNLSRGIFREGGNC